jgi:hypothetical protein
LIHCENYCSKERLQPIRLETNGGVRATILTTPDSVFVPHKTKEYNVVRTLSILPTPTTKSFGSFCFAIGSNVASFVIAISYRRHLFFFVLNC